MSNQKQELQQHYLNTTYSVFIEDKQHDIKIGKTLPPAIQELLNKESSAAILTAWNPRSQVLPVSENKTRNTKLNLKLKKYTVYEAVGKGNDPSWSAEESFFILGIKKKDVDRLAVDFEQNAYVWLESDQQASIIFTELW